MRGGSQGPVPPRAAAAQSRKTPQEHSPGIMWAARALSHPLPAMRPSHPPPPPVCPVRALPVWLALPPSCRVVSNRALSSLSFILHSTDSHPTLVLTEGHRHTCARLDVHPSASHTPSHAGHTDFPCWSHTHIHTVLYWYTPRPSFLPLVHMHGTGYVSPPSASPWTPGAPASP